ncbi:MAG: hypothetical protein WEB37_00410, partial [Bacteroidota bacterium]
MKSLLNNISHITFHLSLPAILALSSAPGQSYYNFRDAFLDRKGQIDSLSLVYAEESPLTRTFQFSLFSSSGDSLHGRIRIPKGEGPFPAALLCV